MNKKIIVLIPSVVLYLFAGLLAAYAVWAYTHCADIISQARAAGQLAAAGNEYDIASFYMGNSGQYFVYALLLAAAGFILQRKQPVINQTDKNVSPATNKAADEELDEWFDDVKSTDANAE